MADLTDYFIKGSDNVISKTLTEDGSPLSVSWTELDIVIGSVTITRTSNADGVSFTSGVLEITPSGLTEDLSALVDGQLYQVYFVVKTAQDPNGVVYGQGDSTNRLFFYVTTIPA